MTVVALLIAIAIPLVALYFIYTLDLYKTGAFRYVLMGFLAGAISYLIAALVNPIPMNAGDISYWDMVRFLAPVTEEILKALILLYLARRPDFTYFVDGAIYGFSTGIGFAILENFEYVLGNPSAALAVAVNRVISTNLMHAAASATVGIVLGLARFKRITGRTALTLAGILLAIALHTGFNNLVTRVEGGLLLLYAILVGGGAATFITLAIKRGLADEKKWIEEKLGAADRVERGEVAAVQRLEKSEEILTPLAEIFGMEKASQIEQLLFTQARLGILRKTHEKLADEKIRTAVGAQIDQLRQEMDRARRAVGSYTMLYLRSTYLEESGSLYKRLEAVLQERAASHQTSKVNIYDTLTQRIPQAANANKDVEK